MALLNFNQQPQQQAGAGGLLNDPMMSMMLLSSMGKRRGGNNNALQTLMQLDNADRQEAQQRQANAMRMAEFGMRQNEYNKGMQTFDMQSQKYQRDLEDYNRQRTAEQGLVDTINQGGEPRQAPMQQQPQAAMQAPAMPSVQPLNPAMMQQGQSPAQQAMPQGQPMPMQQGPLANAVQNAIRPDLSVPDAPSDQEMQKAFSSVNPVNENGQLSQGAIQKRKLASYLVQMGKSNEAMSLLKSGYGQPIAVSNAKGESKYILVNDDGEVKELPKDYLPIRQKGIIVRDGNGNVVFEQGGSETTGATASATNTVQSDLQKDIISNQSHLSNLDKIAENYKSSYLTYGGQARGTFDKYYNKITGQSIDKDYLQGITKFNTGTEQMFNQYRKDITGAAASVQELDRLKKSMLNKDMAPDEFEAAYGQFKDIIVRGNELKQQFARQGIPVNSPQMGKMIDEQLFGGSPQNLGANTMNEQTMNHNYSNDQLDQMAQQAISQGRDPQAVQQMLEQMRRK